jgi:DNA-binding protein
MNSDHDSNSAQQHDPHPVVEDKEAKTNRDDGIVRVSRTSSIRNQIGYAMKRVKSGEQVTITGLGSGISRAITIASIVRDRVGNVHMLNSFHEVSDKKRPDTTVTGIRIVLTTKSDLDNSDNGYQEPEP